MATRGSDKSPGTVVAAAIVRGGKVLAAQRKHPPELVGKWELPGGKREPGETDEAALSRECREELGVEVSLQGRLGDDTVTVTGSAVLKVWWATILTGEPQPLDHAELRWLGPDDLDDVDWLAADLPLVGLIRARLST